MEDNGPCEDWIEGGWRWPQQPESGEIVEFKYGTCTEPPKIKTEMFSNVKKEVELLSWSVS